MKYKIIGVIGCAVILLVSIINYPEVFSFQSEKERFHQHMEAEKKRAVRNARRRRNLHASSAYGD